MDEDLINKAVREVLVRMGYNDPDRAIAGGYAPYRHARDIVEAVLFILKREDEDDPD